MSTEDHHKKIAGTLNFAEKCRAVADLSNNRIRSGELGPLSVPQSVAVVKAAAANRARKGRCTASAYVVFGEGFNMIGFEGALIEEGFVDIRLRSYTSNLLRVVVTF